MNHLELAATYRAAATLLAKSPIWSLLADHMGKKLAFLESEVLNNGSLSAADLEKRRDERLFLRKTLIDFAHQFRSSFTNPPPSEDISLQKMPVPPEVEAALQRLISPVSSSPRPAAPPARAPADPLNIDPFSGKPLTSP